MRLSTLGLEAYFIREISMKTKLAAEKPEDPGIPLEDLSILVGINQHPDERHRWMIQLEVATQDPKETKVPYEIRLVVDGFFSVDQSIGEEEAEKLVTNAAPPLLYSVSREVIASHTSRAVWGEVFLPSVAFGDSLWKARKIESANKKGTKKKVVKRKKSSE